MVIETLPFFHNVVKSKHNSTSIHRLKVDSSYREDPMLIEGYILGFYKELYSFSSSNMSSVGNMDDFINLYIPN